ncbi:MAG TPA: thioredoxin family protein [Gemmatimonadaceae bacterium]|nr:thioredoxin family protein [Gemmatimonadaceae bacterium]
MSTTLHETDLKRRFAAAPTYAEYAAGAQKNLELWQSIYRLATVDADAVERVRALPGRWQLLVLSEDWCGDAFNTVPVLAKLADLAPNLELRVLGRDANPDLMDAHLSPTGARAIPVVMVLDEDFVERGWWGSRPGPLQAWVTGEGMRLPPGERYPRVRQWYARDRGRTTVEEVVRLLERSASARRPSGSAAIPSAGA